MLASSSQAYHAGSVAKTEVQSKQTFAILVSVEGILCAKSICSCKAGGHCQLVHVQHCSGGASYMSVYYGRKAHIPDHAPA